MNPSPRLSLERAGLVAAALVVVSAGLGAGWWSIGREREVIAAQLQDDAERCAVAFAGGELQALTGTRADLDTPPYRAVKDRLTRLREVSPRVRFVYLFRHLPATGTVVYLADSAPSGAKDESKPGDEYANFQQPDRARGLRAIIRSHESAIEGPEKDEFGEWVTGYALVGSAPAAGAPTDILGLDIAAADWRRRLGQAGAAAAVYVWLLLGLPLAGFVFLRHRQRQMKTIHTLSEAIEQSRSGVIVTDLGRRITYVNHGACVTFGYGRDELVGRPIRSLFDATEPAERLDRIRTELVAGRPWQGGLTARHRNDHSFPLRVLASPVRDRAGAVTGFVAVVDDISDLKKTEQELRQARERAEAGDRAKSEFLTMMSHELRTPLNGIIGFAGLLLESPLSAEQRDYATTVRTSGEALLALTNELLDFARIDAGRLRLDPQPCAIRGCVEDAIGLLSEKAAGKNLELLVDVDETVPACAVLDPLRLRQVLVNLLGNAVKFTPAGEVQLAVRGEPAVRPVEDGAHARLCFEVRDTGIGIAPEHHARLFQPFSQVESELTRSHGGTGLGLAICRSLLRLMGGDIAVESRAGAGAVFRFHFEARIIEPAPPPPRLPPGRVLIIARGAAVREFYGRLAQRWGATVVAYAAPEQVPAGERAEVLVADIDPLDARRWPDWLKARPELAARSAVGIVPVNLPALARDHLRPAFCTLLKKPVRDALLHAVLHSGLQAPAAGGAAVAGGETTPPVRPGAPGHRPGLRVLLAEANPVVLRLMRHLLENAGCHVETVADGQECLERLAARPFDAAWLDLQLAGIDGLTVIRLVRAGEAGAAAGNLWLAALTTDVASVQRELAVAAGANDYLAKPVALDEVEAALARIAPVRR